MKRVVIIGGGYAGITAAKELDSIAQVTVVEKKNLFYHHIAAPRALVEQPFQKKLFIPYDKVLKRGKIIHSEAIEISPKEVKLKNGETLQFDYLILALGSSYSFPGRSVDDTSAQAHKLADTYAKLKESTKVLIIGGGPVGIEIAGEIASTYPKKQVTIVHAQQEILPEDAATNFRTKIRTQLENDLKVKVITGETIQLDEIQEDTKIFTTNKGTKIEADMHFLTVGNTPNTKVLEQHFGPQLTSNKLIKVNAYLQVEGYQNIFAIGDITNIAEWKTAVNAAAHVTNLVQNIKSLIQKKSTLKPYKSGAKIMMIPLGKNNGAVLLPFGTFGSWIASFKGKDYFTGRYWKTMKQTIPQ